MRLYSNITEVMREKKLTRKQAKKQVGRTIFELARPLGDQKCYIVYDDLILWIWEISKQMFKK